MTKISILVVYHKQAELLYGEDFLAINAGRSVCSEREKQWLVENTLGDDVGDNISEKNPTYNELTAVYWAWKNLDSDYYGLMHYRRHFIFADGKKPYCSVKKMGDGYLKDKLCYSAAALREILDGYDFVAPMPMVRKSVYEHYKNAHDICDLDYAMEVIAKDYKEYNAACQKYVYGRDSYFYNMFIFDKATFDRYCRFVFGVLNVCEQKFSGKRMFLSERLTGIFITQLISEGKKGKFLPTMYVSSKPTFKQAVAQTKANLAERKKTGGGLKSLVYAFKPLLIIFVPEFIFKLYRNRK